MKRRGRIAIAVAAAAAIVGIIAAAGLPVYVFPPPGDAAGADLVYVIGPPTAQRVDLARSLLDSGDVGAALISVPDSGDQSAAELDICRDARVTCRHPTPFTTKGEVRMLEAYATDADIGKTVVITFTPHVARTRYIFGRCYDGVVSVVTADTRLSILDWIFQYGYQTSAFVKAWATPCD